MSNETDKILERCEKKLSLIQKYPSLGYSQIVYEKDGDHFSIRHESPIDLFSDEEIDRLLKK